MIYMPGTVGWHGMTRFYMQPIVRKSCCSICVSIIWNWFWHMPCPLYSNVLGMTQSWCHHDMMMMMTNTEILMPANDGPLSLILSSLFTSTVVICHNSQHHVMIILSLSAWHYFTYTQNTYCSNVIRKQNITVIQFTILQLNVFIIIITRTDVYVCNKKKFFFYDNLNMRSPIYELLQPHLSGKLWERDQVQLVPYRQPWGKS